MQLSAVDGAVVADVTNAAGVRIPSEVIVLEVEVTEVVLRITLSNLKKVLLLGFSELEILEALHQDFEFPTLYIMQKSSLSDFSPQIIRFSLVPFNKIKGTGSILQGRWNVLLFGGTGL